jgi:hypothetical protein
MQAYRKDESALGAPFVVVKDAGGLVGAGDAARSIMATAESLLDLTAEQK